MVLHDSPVVRSLVRWKDKPLLFHLPIEVAGTLPLAGIAVVQAFAVSSVVVGTFITTWNLVLDTDVSFEPSAGIQLDTLSANLIVSWFDVPVLVSGGENFARPVTDEQATLPFAMDREWAHAVVATAVVNAAGSVTSSAIRTHLVIATPRVVATPDSRLSRPCLGVRTQLVTRGDPNAILKLNESGVDT